MSRSALNAIGLAAVLIVSVVTPAVAANTTRADSYYEVWCNLGTDRVFQAESVDARAVQLDKNPGGKDTGVANYTLHNPFGDVCTLVGPFSN